MAVIYCKFSNDRSERYNIKTSIEEENNKRIVYKDACSLTSESHINKLVEYNQWLQKAYDNTIFEVNHCEWDGNRLAFEYIEGKTLEEIMDELKGQKRYSDIIALMKEYEKNINTISGKKKFIKTQEFKDVFGDIEGLEKFEAFDVSNIDMVFGNVIIHNHKWIIIDYEWTFSFPIPIKFIIYRALYYYISGSQKREDLLKLNLYEHFDIPEQDRLLFCQMEQNYQAYVNNEHTSLWNLQESMNKQQIRVDLLQNQVNKLLDVKPLYAQVYYDDGEGYSETNSEKIDIVGQFPQKMRFKLQLKPNRKYRIDPCNVSCYQNNIHFYNENRKEIMISYRCNGDMLEQGILFLTTDPQMELDIGQDLLSEIWCEYEIAPMENSESEAYKQIIFIIQKLQTINMELSNKLQQETEEKDLLKKDIEYLNDEKYSLSNSIEILQNKIEKLEEIMTEQEIFIKKVKSLLPFKIYDKCKQLFQKRR